jgi:hypothetical protein
LNSEILELARAVGWNAATDLMLRSSCSKKVKTFQSVWKLFHERRSLVDPKRLEQVLATAHFCHRLRAGTA